MNNYLKLNVETGLLEPISYRPSPHYNERPNPTHIDLLVIHGISLPPGEFGSSMIEDFFCGQFNPLEHPQLADLAHLKVSAHLLIKRTGEIVQFVPFTKRAWHAGVSSFQGRTGCNDFSIGIELEGTDDLAYEEAQYRQLSCIIPLLRQTYPGITQDRIVGHVDIAPDRKTDPGPAFDWDYLKGILA